MAKLIYMMDTSFDGYIEDGRGDFGFAAPVDEELRASLDAHASSSAPFSRTQNVRDDGLLGDRAHASPSDEVRKRFARQSQTAEKIVCSKTLAEPHSGNTSIERSFDPETVRKLKSDTVHDVSVQDLNSPRTRSKPALGQIK